MSWAISSEDARSQTTCNKVFGLNGCKPHFTWLKIPIPGSSTSNTESASLGASLRFWIKLNEKHQIGIGFHLSFIAGVGSNDCCRLTAIVISERRVKKFEAGQQEPAVSSKGRLSDPALEGFVGSGGWMTGPMRVNLTNVPNLHIRA
jgi:hypothetical protein